MLGGMIRGVKTLDPAAFVRGVLIFGLLFVLAVNLPGQLSHDSVMELYNGQTGVFTAFDPPFFVALLGMLERIVPGSALFVTMNAALFFFSLISLTRLVPRVSWLAVPVAIAIVLSPLTIIDQGTVWKDIFFANLAIAGFVALAHAAAATSRSRRLLLVAASVVLLAFASLARQNGLISLLGGSVAVAVLAARAGRRTALLYAAAVFAAGLAIIQVTNVLLSGGAGEGIEQRTIGVGIRMLQQYDIIGSTYFDPHADLSRLGNPAVEQGVRDVAANYYSPVRSEFLGRAPKSTPSLWLLPPEAIRDEWTWLVFHDPGAYFHHRLAVFRWTAFSPSIAQCSPAYVGVTGPPQTLKALHLNDEVRPQDQAIYNYATYFFYTPVYAHVTYAACGAIIIVLLALRRRPADVAIVFLLLSGLAFAASFFAISVACDFRYLYFLDAAVMAALLYVAIDPPLDAFKLIRSRVARAREPRAPAA
jgi:hypothetical protein